MSSSSDNPFLQSMTFASVGEHIRMCDCDECDNIPLSILAAVRERKRQRLETMPLKRTQLRELVQRYGLISVYRLTLPLGAEALLEFGISHRVIWIQRLPGESNSAIHSIGTGIIGSSDEEKSRQCLADWKEGSAILVPSNGGKAVGWIHDKRKNGDKKLTNNNEKGNNVTGHAVFFVAKIPADTVNGNVDVGQQQSDPNSMEQPTWVNTLLTCCEEGLKDWARNNSASNKTEQQPQSPYFQFSPETGKVLIQAIQDAKKS